MKKISKIISLLKKEYGTPEFDSYSNPLDELILTILSQNTSWQNCRRSFDSLKRSFKNWKEVASAHRRSIACAIKCGGLSQIKSKRIKNLLDELYRQKGSFNMNFLKEMEPNSVFRFLTSIKGVGPKTAACVMLFSLQKPVLPVDTHILRVSKRLGLIDENADLIKAHKSLGTIVPKNKQSVLSFHINMIEHGRRTCKAKKPHCLKCVLKGLCTYIAQRGVMK